MTPSVSSKCAWCGQSLPSADGAENGWLDCRFCGVGTTFPWPTPDELEAAYGDTYRPPGGRFIAFGDQLLGITRGRLAKRLDRFAPPGDVLDVGAGDGSLVRSVRSRGRTALGIERAGALEVANRGSYSSVEAATSHDIVSGDLEDLGGSWAAVVFWHSLEHLPQPRRALDHAITLLMPEGLLVVALPNPASWQARCFGLHWFARDLPRHLAHIPAPVLLSYLREKGLRIERVSYIRGGQMVFGWLAGLVGALPGDLDLYEAVRSEPARSSSSAPIRHLTSLVAGAVMLPIAAVLAAAEAVARRGGTLYVEARR